MSIDDVSLPTLQGYLQHALAAIQAGNYTLVQTAISRLYTDNVLGATLLALDERPALGKDSLCNQRPRF